MTDPDKLDRPVLMHHLQSLALIIGDATTGRNPILGTAARVRAACECAKLPIAVTELGYALTRMVEKRG